MSAQTAEAADRLFAERMRVIRKARGLGGQNLAARLGRHHRFVYDIELRHRRVSIGEAVAICAALGVEPLHMSDAGRPVETLIGGAE